MITCTKCKKSKPPDQFLKRSDRSSGRRSQCTECLNKSNRARARRRRYGITEAEYKSILKAHNGRCAICGSPRSKKAALAIDHCHRTKQIRGVLCLSCNLALGHLQDNPTIVLAAAEYLIKIRGQ